MSAKVVQGFYDSLRKTFFALRLIGAFPVSGLLNRNSKLSRCTWITPYTVYLVVTLTSIIGCCLLHLHDVITSTRQFKEYGGLILHCFASVALIFILRLSFNWTEIMDKIDRIEKQLPPFKNGRLVARNINRAMAYIALFVLVDHILYLNATIRIVQLCEANYHIYEVFSAEKYFKTYFAYTDKVLPHNIVIAIWLQIMKTQTTFIFCYIDVIVIAVALYLIFRFQNFMRLMKQKMAKCNGNTKWCDIQAHYTHLTRLVIVVDDLVNPFIFMSFLSGLVFTCKMIYDFIQYQKKYSDNSNNGDCVIRNSTDNFVVANIISTAIYRLSKVLLISSLSSYLNSLSRKPLEALHTLPAAAYNFEFQRFMDQVYYTKVCLSGLRFFYVTRGTILSITPIPAELPLATEYKNQVPSYLKATLFIGKIPNHIGNANNTISFPDQLLCKKSCQSLACSMISTIITYELVLLQLPVLY